MLESDPKSKHPSPVPTTQKPGIIPGPETKTIQGTAKELLAGVEMLENLFLKISTEVNQNPAALGVSTSLLK